MSLAQDFYPAAADAEVDDRKDSALGTHAGVCFPDRTSRNPNGEEGPRPTGNAFTGVGNSFAIAGKNVITVYYAKARRHLRQPGPKEPGANRK